MLYLPNIEIETANSPANASVIWLHGLGASGDDFVPVAKQMSFTDDIAIRYIFPHAPLRAITINGGMQMPAWYDFTINGIERVVNEGDLAQSVGYIEQLIARELDRGVASERIILAGFSQGGAVAYEVAFSFAKPLAGLMALSTYIAKPNTIIDKVGSHDFPVAIYHGKNDDVVPDSMGRDAFALLSQEGVKVQTHSYNMDHSVCLAEIRDINTFIQTCLSD